MKGFFVITSERFGFRLKYPGEYSSYRSNSFERNPFNAKVMIFPQITKDNVSQVLTSRVDEP